MRNREEAKRRAKELVAQMTVEEKASQLRYDAPAIPRLNVPAYNWWNEGLHGVARAGTATVSGTRWARIAPPCATAPHGPPATRTSTP